MASIEKRTLSSRSFTHRIGMSNNTWNHQRKLSGEVIKETYILPLHCISVKACSEIRVELTNYSLAR